ncbi:MAG: hypothetical protein OEQ25_18570, partial [Gammaproteobacteria bacterium]|nr:hypothetical protein [Gammaproteobacteria bacterium]
ATVLALILMPVVTASVPMITLQLTSASVIRTGVAGVLVAVLASIVPARRIAKVDPMTAFRG